MLYADQAIWQFWKESALIIALKGGHVKHYVQVLRHTLQ